MNVKLEELSIRQVSTKGNSLAVTIPTNWAKEGETIGILIKNEHTLIISKNLEGLSE